MGKYTSTKKDISSVPPIFSSLKQHMVLANAYKWRQGCRGVLTQSAVDPCSGRGSYCNQLLRAPLLALMASTSSALAPNRRMESLVLPGAGLKSRLRYESLGPFVTDLTGLHDFGRSDLRGWHRGREAESELCPRSDVTFCPGTERSFLQQRVQQRSS